MHSSTDLSLVDLRKKARRASCYRLRPAMPTKI
ncbi:unnamed protein product [Nippostrongylus brasiliensis]|uniref:Nitroreductase n=1 Tax=Nippostrongylus brasiliensis TaxID=27835 RepID=A0A0N4YZV8_NIPBR|nr:unnamed protein product [Nippostrongylus brasiliensis]